MLPEKYENKKVLWIETEAKHKVWPYSNRSWKRIKRKLRYIRTRRPQTVKTALTDLSVTGRVVKSPRNQVGLFLGAALESFQWPNAEN